MSLFSALSVGGMDDASLATLIEVCIGIVPELEENHPHRAAYADLEARLKAEQRRRAQVLAERNRAATVLQAMTRGMLERQKLEKQTKLALTLQAAFRGREARKQFADMKAEAQKKELERLAVEQAQREAKEREEAELAAAAKAAEAKATAKAANLARAGVALAEKKVNPADVKEDALELLGELLMLYDAAELAKKKAGKKAGSNHPTVRKRNAARNASDAQLNGIMATVKSDLAEKGTAKGGAAEKKVVKLPASITLPADFTRSGDWVNCVTFLYPGAGRLKIRSKTYNIHPNRTLLHVKQEVADNATVADAQKYFDSCMAACRELIAAKDKTFEKKRYKDGKEWKIAFKWVKSDDYAGEIYHIDSGYEYSAWLPATKKGKCKCGLAKNRHPAECKTA